MQILKNASGLFMLSLAILCLSIQQGFGRTLDEIIAGASNDISGFDFLADLNGDTVRQELDMILTKTQWMALQELRGVSISDDPSQLTREKRKAIKSLFYRWPKNEIPYRIVNGVFSARDMEEVNKAMREWEDNTCIRFRGATSRDTDHVVFQDGSGCSSYVGKSGGEHPIALAGGCRYKGVIAHEIGHAVGFYHEQNRPDRDEYIIIEKDNILSPNLYHNFDKYPWSSVSTYDVPYDYRSIMHYGGRAFSGNGQYTIKTIDPNVQEIIGNREGLSFYDIKLANLMYECNQGCDASIRCPGEGFVGKDCKCYCPGNPVQLCDDAGSVVTQRPTQQTTARSTARPCLDMNQYCSGWAGEGYCQTNTYVKTYCKASCNLCQGSIATTQKPCRDLREHCNYWKGEGYCTGMFENFMSENCPESCGRCGNNPVDTRAGFTNTRDNGSDNGVGFASSSLMLVFSAAFIVLKNVV